MARFGFLTRLEREQLAAICHRLLGKDEMFDWDRAYVVRKEAEETLRHCQAG